MIAPSADARIDDLERANKLLNARLDALFAYFARISDRTDLEPPEDPAAERDGVLAEVVPILTAVK